MDSPDLGAVSRELARMLRIWRRAGSNGLYEISSRRYRKCERADSRRKGMGREEQRIAVDGEPLAECVDVLAKPRAYFKAPSIDRS